MKIPRKTVRYCPFCKKRSEHKINQVKTKPRPKTKKGAFKWGIRHQAKIEAGYGSFPKPKAAEKKKTSTRATFKYVCSTCNKTHIGKNSKRAKKLSQI